MKSTDLVRPFLKKCKTSLKQKHMMVDALEKIQYRIAIILDQRNSTMLSFLGLVLDVQVTFSFQTIDVLSPVGEMWCVEWKRGFFRKTVIVWLTSSSHTSSKNDKGADSRYGQYEWSISRLHILKINPSFQKELGALFNAAFLEQVPEKVCTGCNLLNPSLYSSLQFTFATHIKKYTACLDFVRFQIYR